MASVVTPLLPAQAGGAQAFLTDLARELGRKHEVALFCASGSDVPGVKLVQVVVDAAVARALVMPGGAVAEPVPAVGDAFRRLFEAVLAWRPDAISQHAFDAEAFDAAEGLPVLHTLHLPPIVPAVVAAVQRSRAPMVTVSDASRSTWAATGVTGLGMIRNGVPDFEITPHQPSRTALLAGRVSPEKGVAEGIAAARRAGLEPLVVGDPYDRSYFEAHVRPQLRTGEFRAAVPRRELWRLMAAAAVTLMPIAWDEPFGLVAAEAQVAGCPVAGFRRGALTEVVAEGEGGILVEPGDVEALAAAAVRVMRFDRSAIRAQARSRLLIEQTVVEYEQALAELA